MSSILVASLILIAFFVQLYRLDAQSLWWDETLSVHRAQGDLAYVLSNKIIIFDDRTIDQHPPLYFLLLHFSVLAFGGSEFAVRSLSTFFSILTVALSYQVGLQLWNRHTGIIAALASAASPFYLWYAQEARPYALVALLTTLSIYFLLKLNITKSARFLVGYLTVAAALLATHYLTAAMILGQILFLAASMLRTKDLRVLGSTAVVLAAGLATAIELPYSVGLYLSQPPNPLTVSIDSVVRDIIVTFSFGVTVNQFAVLPFALGLFLVATIAIATGTRQLAKARLLLLLVCTIVPLATVYLISLYKTIYGTRYVIFLAPMYYLFLGLGGAQLQRRRPFLGATFGLVLLAMFAFGSYDYLKVNNNYRQDYRGAAAYITEYAKAGDAIVLDDKKIVTAFEYYLKADYPLFGVPRVPASDRETITKEIREIAAQHPRVWLVLSMSADSDPEGLVETILKDEYFQLDTRVLTGRTYSVDISLYSTTPYDVNGLPCDAVKKMVNFDNQLALGAYRIKRQAGIENRLDVDLYWKVQNPTLPKLAMFGQLIDREGNVWGSFDGEPFNGFFPTDQWKGGTLVADQRQLWITPGAPPGRYSLRLGVRPAEPGSERLSVRDKDGAVANEVAEIPDAVELAEGIGGDLRSLVFTKYYEAKFDDTITLLGGDSLPRGAFPGEELTFRLFWRNEVAQPEELDVQLSLVSPKGDKVGVSTIPISSLYPRASWRQGQIVGTYYSIVLPAGIASGDYQITLAMMRRADRTLRPVRFGLYPFSSNSLELGTVSVTTPERQYGLPAAIVPVEARLSHKVELLGFSLATPDNAAVSAGQDGLARIEVKVPADRPIGVTLWWKPLAEMGSNYSVFVQVLNSEGQLVDQHDGIPSEGRRPTAGWVAAEVIQDTHQLAKTARLPKGNYALIVGLYDRETGKRLELGGRNQDFIRIAEIVVPEVVVN